jgi:hypothetical protein
MRTSGRIGVAVVIGSILSGDAEGADFGDILIRMTEPIVYVDRSDIRTQDVAALRAAIARLVDFVEEREPQLLVYRIHLDEPASTIWVVAVHPDAASLELHLRIGGPEFRKVGEFIVLRAIDVYGDVGEEVMGMLQDKARMLGGATVTAHPPLAGFART